MRDAIESVVGCFAMFVAIMFFRWEVARFNRKYRLNDNDQQRLFFFLFHGSDAGRLLTSRPDMMRKEFPETVAAIESYRLRNA